jgi:hypothetical protein
VLRRRAICRLDGGSCRWKRSRPFSRLAERIPKALRQIPGVVLYVELAATQAKVGNVLVLRQQVRPGVKLLQDSEARLVRIQEETGGDAIASDWLGKVRTMLASIPGGNGD